MIISIWNSFGPQTKQYKELDKIGALMDFQTWPQSAGLNFSLSNIPYWNSDIGGFFLSRFRKKLEDAEYREL
jgi:hypothetical protein